MKIELIPAIDIIGGQCVRLTKGDYDQKTVYGKPIDMAKEFERIGFNRLHVVDLDGAKSRHIVNDAVLREITSNTKLTVDFGGGIKSHEDVDAAFQAGAQMVTIGSVVSRNPSAAVHMVVAEVWTRPRGTWCRRAQRKDKHQRMERGFYRRPAAIP